MNTPSASVGARDKGAVVEHGFKMGVVVVETTA